MLRIFDSSACDERFLGFNNKTCGAVGARPLLLRNGAAAVKWGNWKVKVMGRYVDGVIEVSFQAAPPPKSKLRCPGYLAPARVGTCPTDSFSSALTISKTPYRWQLYPSVQDEDPDLESPSLESGSLFWISATERHNGCIKFLGASTSSCDATPHLYYSDTPAVNRRWEVSPGRGIKPGKPTATSTDSGKSSTFIKTISWKDGTPGIPKETYQVSCVESGEDCRSTAVVASAIVARGTGAAKVGLPSVPMDLMCYVVANNSFGKSCSGPVYLSTRDMEYSELPSVGFAAHDTFVRVTWTGGLEFYPQETYKAWCVREGQGCEAPAVGSTVVARRDDQTATVQGLQPLMIYNCFLTISNGAIWHPFMRQITTLAQPVRAPRPPTAVQILIASPIKFEVVWKDGPLAFPKEEYTVGT
jgi:hypothetical protein